MIIILCYIQNSRRIYEDRTMCKILEKIGGLNAGELLSKYNISLTPPINLSLLIERIGISAYSVDFTEAEEAAKYPKGTIVGAALSFDDDLDIMYAQGLTPNRIRFTVAHELAHCCLHAPDLKIKHIELRTSEMNEVENAKEIAANIFAGELLIPEKPLLDIFGALLKPSISALARIFQVSDNVMRARLKYLELPIIE